MYDLNGKVRWLQVLVVNRASDPPLLLVSPRKELMSLSPNFYNSLCRQFDELGRNAGGGLKNQGAGSAVDRHRGGRF